MMNVNKKHHYRTFIKKTIKRQDGEIQGFLHPIQISFEYFLAWFQSLPSNPICLLKHVFNCEQNFSFFVF
jgi:hypothetical protein